MAKKQRAALICRVSTPQQIKLGLESQVAVLKKQASKDGYEVPNELIFQEQISGLDAKKPIRKSLQDLMDAVEDKRVDVCYTYELTRISRDPYNLVERVKWFTDRHIPMYIYDADMWTLDRVTKEELEETTSYVFGAATYGKVEAKKMKMRTMRARNEVAKEGLYVGHLSDGYCVVETERGKEIKIDEDRKEVIQKIFDLYTQGYTIDRIAETLNTSNIPSANSYRLNSPKFKGYRNTYHRKGSDLPFNRVDVRWQGATISNYLRNKWYIGERTYNKQQYSIDPIIKAEQWSIVSAMLERNAISFRSKRESTKHPYLLSGLLFCGKCGKRMYGHYTGLNNHYFCSSVEEGVKCGLRGVCKENIEAAVALVVKQKGGLDVVEGKEGVVGNFFKVSPQEEKRLREEMKANNNLIAEIDKKSDELSRNYAEAVKQTIIHASDKNRVAVYESLISEIEDEKNNLNNKKYRLTQQNILNTKKLNVSSNADKILSRLMDERNLATLRELFVTVIDKVHVFNLTPSIDVIIINFVDGTNESFLYSYRLMKQNIKIFTHSLFYYDVRENVLKHKGSNDVLDAKELIKSDPLKIPFERLEEQTDKAKEQDAKYKEWRKKYNNGLPTCVPYVVKDETYEEISLKKKHLYNRKYKIKKHKKLTDDEKKRRLAEIDKELALLTAKVKYLNREEALKNYNESHKGNKNT